MSGCAGDLSRPKIAGLGELDSGTWILWGILMNTPCVGFDCRNEGSAETAGAEEGSQTRNNSTPVSAAAQRPADIEILLETSFQPTEQNHIFQPVRFARVRKSAVGLRFLKFKS
jgi:hypothetical protein